MSISGAVSQLSPFGRLLRHWRALRGMSQLNLATEAGVSGRHISFVETGRAQPSREMVLRVAESLDLPLRERNALLAAAGFAAYYRETGIDTPEMEPLNRVIAFLLNQHEPFPAFLMDRCWNVLRSNSAAVATLGRFAGPGRVWSQQPLNLIRITLHPEGLRPHMLNWDEIAVATIATVRRTLAASGSDRRLSRLLDEILTYPDLPSMQQGAAELESAPYLVLPIHLKRDDLELRLFSAVTTMGTPQDITLQELRMESFMPADVATESALRAIAATT